METKTCLVAVSYTHLTLPTNSLVGSEMCIRDREKRMATAAKTAYLQLKPDVILLMAKLTLDFGDYPVVNGIPLVTGIGKDKVLAELKEVLSR